MLHKKKSPFLIKKRTFPIQHHLHPYRRCPKSLKIAFASLHFAKVFCHTPTTPTTLTTLITPTTPITPTPPTYNFS